MFPCVFTCFQQSCSQQCRICVCVPQFMSFLSPQVKAETITEAGEPYELISSAVQKNKINLLVIGNTLVNGTLKRLVFFKLFFLRKKSAIWLNCPVIKGYLFICLNHLKMSSRTIMTY